MATVTRNCNHCGNPYEARTADIKRGWGLSCSKRCAAIVRTYGNKPKAKASKKYPTRKARRQTEGNPEYFGGTEGDFHMLSDDNFTSGM